MHFENVVPVWLPLSLSYYCVRIVLRLFFIYILEVFFPGGGGVGNQKGNLGIQNVSFFTWQ